MAPLTCWLDVGTPMSPFSKAFLLVAPWNILDAIRGPVEKCWCRQFSRRAWPSTQSLCLNLLSSSGTHGLLQQVSWQAGSVDITQGDGISAQRTLMQIWHVRIPEFNPHHRNARPRNHQEWKQKKCPLPVDSPKLQFLGLFLQVRATAWPYVNPLIWLMMRISSSCLQPRLLPPLKSCD